MVTVGTGALNRETAWLSSFCSTERPVPSCPTPQGAVMVGDAVVAAGCLREFPQDPVLPAGGMNWVCVTATADMPACELALSPAPPPGAARLWRSDSTATEAPPHCEPECPVSAPPPPCRDGRDGSSSQGKAEGGGSPPSKLWRSSKAGDCGTFQADEGLSDPAWLWGTAWLCAAATADPTLCDAAHPPDPLPGGAGLGCEEDPAPAAPPARPPEYCVPEPMPPCRVGASENKGEGGPCSLSRL